MKPHVVHLNEVAPESSPHGLAALLRTPDDRVRRDTSVILTPDQTDGRGMTVGYTVVYPGCSTRGHAHRDREEIYLIVRGRGAVIVDGEELRVGADDVLYIPPGPPHTTRNEDPTPLEYYWITVPYAPRS